ncbi:TrbI/VirB10 family protein [Xanthomonas sp. XNM01]|uniref:TrbI/VirB10 family protein n=1 Tax=Xanthomonas sp. XNM01 TaxID=2769289 RepID=UPI001780F370|nr:TrbI/VirB10 family protein [Xanthomonas sp. XNM01]
MSTTPPDHRDEHGVERPHQPAANPYQGRQAPDLDADAPYLNSADVQRLNRKALVFLGGIVVLLVAIVAWIAGGGLSSEDERPRQQASEQVVIPAAPRDLPELPPAQPVPPPMPELPPLPVIEDPDPTGSMMGMSGTDFMQQRPPTLLERRLADVGGGGGDLMESMMPGSGAGAGAGEDMQRSVMEAPATGATSAQPLYKPDTLLLRGTYIRCVLQSRVITDFPGYTSCVVTEPVYSVNGRRLLLPRGSRVQGTYGSDSIVGDRAAIVWDRITTPTGLDINMRSPGVDALGSAGNEGHYTAHWGQRISSALLLSMLSDAFKYAGAKHGEPSYGYGSGVIVQNPYESTTARTMERMANLAMERNMARPPTVTINQGTMLNVYVARDVDFSAVVR